MWVVAGPGKGYYAGRYDTGLATNVTVLGECKGRCTASTHTLACNISASLPRILCYGVLQFPGVLLHATTVYHLETLFKLMELLTSYSIDNVAHTDVRA